MKIMHMPEEVAEEYLQSFHIVNRAVRAFKSGCQMDKNDITMTPATLKKHKSAKLHQAQIREFPELTSETDVYTITNFLRTFQPMQNAVAHYSDCTLGPGEYAEKEEDGEEDNEDDEDDEDSQDREDREDREDGVEGV